jgi:hypothetical protein
VCVGKMSCGESIISHKWWQKKKRTKKWFVNQRKKKLLVEQSTPTQNLVEDILCNFLLILILLPASAEYESLFKEILFYLGVINN